MSGILSASIDKVIDLLASLGYPGVFLISLLDRLTVFLVPAEIVLPAFGVLVNQGVFQFWPTLVWVTVGSFLGNLGLYLLFLKGGRPFLEKHGRYFMISKHDLSHLDRWSLNYGNKIVFWGYLIPTAIRSLVPIFAGISKMRLGKFTIFTLIASLPLNIIYLMIGMKLGGNLENILNYLERANYVVIFILILGVIWYVYRHKKRKHLTHE